MEWSVFGVIAALAAFVLSVVTPIIKLNTIITELSTIVKRMSDDLNDLTDRNAKMHDRIFEKIDNHERRINKLEISEGIDNVK